MPLFSKLVVWYGVCDGWRWTKPKPVVLSGDKRVGTHATFGTGNRHIPLEIVPERNVWIFGSNPFISKQMTEKGHGSGY